MQRDRRARAATSSRAHRLAPRLAPLFAVASLAAAVAACESVPDLTFASGTSTAPAAPPADDDPFDAAASDAGSDAAPDDAARSTDAAMGRTALCADGVPPPGATACCGLVVCFGPCNPGDCGKCASDCAGPNAACCTDRHPLACTTLEAGCP